MSIILSALSFNVSAVGRANTNCAIDIDNSQSLFNRILPELYCKVGRLGLVVAKTEYLRIAVRIAAKRYRKFLAQIKSA